MIIDLRSRVKQSNVHRIRVVRGFHTQNLCLIESNTQLAIKKLLHRMMALRSHRSWESVTDGVSP